MSTWPLNWRVVMKCPDLACSGSSPRVRARARRVQPVFRVLDGRGGRATVYTGLHMREGWR